MTTDYTNAFADEEVAVANEISIVKIDAENAGDFNFDDEEEDFSGATFTSVMEKGNYVIRVDEFTVPSAIVVPGKNGGRPIPRARGIKATVIFDIKNSKQMERKMPTTFYIVTKEGANSPFGAGQLATAYAAIHTATQADEMGTTSASWKKAMAQTLASIVAGEIKQVDIRANGVGVLLQVPITVRGEREVKGADGNTQTYSASNEMNWSKATLVPDAVMDALADQ